MSRRHANTQTLFRVAHPRRNKVTGEIQVSYEGPYETSAPAKGMVTRSIKLRARYGKPDPDWIPPVVEQGTVSWDTTEVDKYRNI